MLYWISEKVHKDVCVLLASRRRRQEAELSEAKMEAGESPARSRHCKGGAFFHKPLRRSRLSVGSEDLGKEKNREDARVRRHAQIWTPIPGIARVQGEQPIGIGAVRRLPCTLHWYLMREDRENKQRKRAAVSRRLAGHDSSFFVCFFRYNTFF